MAAGLGRITVFLASLGLMASAALGGQEIWTSQYPLQLSDGTELPAPFATQAQLDERLAETRRHYAPFTRDLLPRSPYEALKTDLSRDAVWLFREDTEARGEMDGWFGIDVAGEGWAEQALPDYREFTLGWYRTTFDAPSWSADRILLRFDAVDYGARVYLNERYIGEHTGYFIPFEIDVTDFLQPTGNVLAVRVENPICWQGHKKEALHGEGMGTVAFNRDRGVVQFSNAAGIYQPVTLVGRPNVHVADLKITPQWPATARVEARIVNHVPSPRRLTLTVSVSPRNFEGAAAEVEQDLILSKAVESVFPIELKEPKYWTPDEPYLYTVRAVVRDEGGTVLHSADEVFGMRWLSELEDGTILLNREPYYLRGTGAFGTFWPASVRQDEDDVVNDLILMKTAHQDIVRPHLHVLPKWFFQYADMYGLMIYFDMPLNGNEGFDGTATDMVPIHGEEIKRQFREAVDLLYNHPSIAIWQFINESTAYRPVRQIPPRVKEFVRLSREIDPTRPVCGVSGFTAWAGVPNAMNHDWWGLGDIHWYAGLIYRTFPLYEYNVDDPAKTGDFTPNYKKLVTEYGAFAYPDWPTWRESFVPWEPPAAAEELYDVRRVPTEEPIYNAGAYLSDVMALNITTRVFGTNVRPLDWIRRTQDHQAYLVKQSTDVFRRRPDVNGFTQFHFRDPGPMTWACSLVDCNRRPKKGFYAFAQACAPRRINLQYEGKRFHGGSRLDGMRLWVYNDPNRPIQATVRNLLTDETGRILAEQQWTQTIPGASRSYHQPVAFQLPAVDTDRKTLYVYAILSDGGGVIDYDCTPIEVFAREEPPQAPPLALYDVIGKTAAVLKQAGVSFRPWTPEAPLEGISLLVIGAYSSDGGLAQAKKAIAAFIEEGGSVLVLNQTQPGQSTSEVFEPDKAYMLANLYGVAAGEKISQDAQPVPCDLGWLPVPVSFLPFSPFIQCSYAQSQGHNRITQDLQRNDLFEWHSGLGYVVEFPMDMWDEEETLISCGAWQNVSAVALKRIGSGKLLLSQLLLVDRYGVDPIATRILDRMVDPDNWARTPVTVDKAASLSADGTQLAVEISIANPTGRTISGDVVDQILQDRAAGVEAVHFKQRVKLEAGETQTIQFTRQLSQPFAGDLPPAVFVFDDGLWACSNMIAVGVDWSSLDRVRRYDFGTPDSPVAEGATPVYPANVFSANTGMEYGWDGRGPIVTAADLHRGGPLMRDCHLSQAKGTVETVANSLPRVFSVKLPAGRYIFRLMAGDSGAGAVAHVASDTLPPVTVRCGGKKVGRLVRQVMRGTATLTFEHTIENEAVVELTLEPSFKGQAVMISAIEIYLRS